MLGESRLELVFSALKRFWSYYMTFLAQILKTKLILITLNILNFNL